MQKLANAALGAAGLALTLAACVTTPATAPAADAETPYYVREGMVIGLNPSITAIWDMQVDVMDDYGNFDPALMDDAKWTALLANARELQHQSQLMGEATRYVAADPNGTLTDPPVGTDLVAIQQRLDEQEDLYRAMSMSLAGHAGQLVLAAEARDAERVTALVNDMQPVCKACHDVFWYPEEYQGS
ncbi:hypothetical protein OZN62_11840 [Aurantiacibacter sp. MUD11]|uniref:hypothetical protein n=1 Tax=Aurantiacibacter sp. MUD11 TaxID=3003265 RepID=UPI0022AAEE62|nr:hypothetical protein [Aurantiacibacter sp. MUD11]WAT17603.1 hypothetical protein OZN62_11840 [Aurantiacibacter sp. MUD11]